MTSQEKQLLLQDICGRMPFCCGGVIVQYLDKYCHKRIGWLASIWRDGSGIIIASIPVWEKDSRLWYLNDFDETRGYEEGATLADIKPYLRPMSSMTEEECKLYDEAIGKDNEALMQDNGEVPRLNLIPVNALNFLLSRHFDFRGLIEKGLALEAKEGMYKTE